MISVDVNKAIPDRPIGHKSNKLLHCACGRLVSHTLRMVSVILMLWIAGEGLQAQNREELEENKRRIEREITLINQMLEETQATAEMNLNQLVILNNRIGSRQNLITNLNSEITLISRKIEEISAEQERLEQELAELKESYARMIYYAHRNRNSYQRIMFIFSSRDFNQAYLRLRYLQQLTRHRQVQAGKIIETTARLEENLAELDEQRQEQQQLLVQQQQEVESLNREREAQAGNVEELQKRERQLLQQLREQEQAAVELQQAIERVIAEERRRAEEAARAAGRPEEEAFTLTPEQQLISENFAGNKGKLPWPLERGIITGTFGQQPHPVIPGIKINNNGIDISTTQGSRARAIFDGVVSRVITIPGGYAIIIRHGEYLSVYANLSEVFVRNGQNISVGQEIGVAATDTREANTYLHLEVWHGNNKLDPAQWIATQN